MFSPDSDFSPKADSPSAASFPASTPTHAGVATTAVRKGNTAGKAHENLFIGLGGELDLAS